SAPPRLEVAVVREQEDGPALLRADAAGLQERRHPGDLLPRPRVAVPDLPGPLLDPRLIPLPGVTGRHHGADPQRRRHPVAFPPTHPSPPFGAARQGTGGLARSVTSWVRGKLYRNARGDARQDRSDKVTR